MRRDRRLAPHPDSPGCPAPYHGNVNAYEKAEPPCRCPDAREDERLYRKRRREQRLRPGLSPTWGARRRLQALAAVGHDAHSIAAHSRGALTVKTIRRLQTEPRAAVMTEFDIAVRRVYSLLAAAPGSSPKARTWALKRGWIPPSEWLPDELDDPTADPRGVGLALVHDEGAVGEAVAGHMHQPLLHLSVTDQDQAVRYLLEHVSPEEAQFRLGCTVDEWRLVVDRVRAQKRRDREKDQRAAQRQQQSCEAA